MNQIFLGEPVQAIKDWFVNTYLTGPDYSNWPTYTTLKFVDGTTQTKEIIGAATWQNIGVKSYGWSNDNTLKYIKIGTNVSGIADGALSGYLVLEKVELPNTIKYIGDNSYDGRAIGECTSLTSIDIPNSVTSIVHGAFTNCSSLTSINIPNSVSSIEDYTFNRCSSLTSINIPNSVTSIGEQAFSDCRSLTSINIPSSVTSIKYWTFENCSSLTSIIFEGKTKSQITSMTDYPWGITNTSIIVPGIS